MRLVLKLTLAMVAAMCVVLAIHAYLRVGREVRLIESDMRDDHSSMGRAFGAAVAEVWRVEGETRALQLVEELNQRETQVLIRWVWLDAPAGDPHHPEVPSEQLQAVRGSQAITSIEVDNRGKRLCTYVPIPLDVPRRGALELSESLTPQEDYIRTTIIGTVVTTALVVGLSGLIAMVLGVWFVGRPMRSLIDKARRVGAGDLSGPLTLRQRDEIGDLAAEMNAMSDRLDEANAKLATAVSARIATLEQLRHADRLATVGKLASGIAHELGTPLNVVAARAKMIASREVHGDEAVDNARIIGEQTQRITAIIRQLLDFARRRSPHKASADLAQLSRQALSLLAPLAAKRQVTVSFQCDNGVTVAEVDVAQFQQALTNLIVNGIHAMPHGGRLSVRLGLAHIRPPADHGGPAGEHFRLDVRDEGEGIPADAIGHIFEPFFTTKGIGEGTGLGLSVSYGIVREHGGWIAVRSEVDGGSCFSIYLPRGNHHEGSRPDR